MTIRFLTAAPGPLQPGRVTRVGALEPVLSAEGVVQAETYLAEGETIRPVRLDGDRRGDVIATAETSVEAFRNSRMLLPTADATSGSLPGPRISSAMTRMTIHSKPDGSGIV